MKKVGILTWHYYSNFGSALQAYALQETLKDVDVCPQFINYRNPKYGTISPFRVLVRYMLGKILPQKFYSPYIFFQKDYFKETKLTQNLEEAKKLCAEMDAVVCGSDQIWAPNAFNSLYMADFEGDNTQRISYAASVGLNDIPDDKAEIYTKLLAKFSDISVREDAGKELLREKCGADAKVVLDPTLLRDVSDYRKIEKKPFVMPEEKYVFCYFLNKDHSYRERVEKYAKERGLTVCGISARAADKEWMQLLPTIGPREFLYLISNADKVITDSYHGTVFSLLYHKDFATLERFSAEDPICQNSRIYQLRDVYGLADRIYPAQKEIEDIPYDYEKFEQILAEKRQASIAFLKEALSC